MLERFERPLKILCAGMALLVLWQFTSAFLRGDPLKNLKIPALPALPGGTNEETKVSEKSTNAPGSEKGATNTAALARNGTNEDGKLKGTNSDSKVTASSTNVALGTNKNTAKTNIARSTNSALPTNAIAGSNVAGTNGAGANIAGTNISGTNIAKGTNASRSTSSTGSTNVIAKSDKGLPGMPPGMPGMPPGMRPGGRGAGPKKMELPAEVKARVDKIIVSEILGAIPHPMPLSLTGIVDEEASIQATNGQTQWVKIGGEIEGVKLLRIGINRVLVEDHGEKKELTLFGGAGGESLMPPPTNSAPDASPSTNAPSTNGPSKKTRMAAAGGMSTNLSQKQKETQ
jgi:hypothetical protein